MNHKKNSKEFKRVLKLIRKQTKTQFQKKSIDLPLLIKGKLL